MGTAKIYVKVNNFGLKNIFDSKFKAKAIEAMQKAATKALKASSKITLDAPKEKWATGFMIDGSLTSLGPDKAGKNLLAACSMYVATWPGKSLKSTQTGEGELQKIDVASLTARDVEEVAGAAAEGAMEGVLAFLAK